MENVRDSQAPGKREPGNAHPNYVFSLCVLTITLPLQKLFKSYTLEIFTPGVM